MSFQFGDVVLMHGNDPISYAIEYLTHSYWSHAMVALDEGTFAQMGPLGLIIEKKPPDMPHLVLRHRELLSPNSPRAREILGQMRQVVNDISSKRPLFDYASMLRLGVDLIRKRMRASVSGEEMASFVCSALVDYIYLKSGLDLLPGRKVTDTTPANLEELAFGRQPVFQVVYDSRKASGQV
ncbi:MAG: hypothetical protein HPY50_19375 [Firmicutes bacterium]|nr:hypothetical protein [Bacillota bacterium]